MSNPRKSGPREKTGANSSPAASVESSERPVSKLDQLSALLKREGGASIAEMMAVTSWQAHSVRGALAGALKKRGMTIISEKADGVRRYWAEPRL